MSEKQTKIKGSTNKMTNAINKKKGVKNLVFLFL